MTDIGPPPRRRGNGLPADKFVPLADVEPRLGEHLLDLLRFADIAAFLEPPADPRVARRPGVGMVQRLYVEHGKRGEARDVVQAAAEEAGIPRTESGPAADVSPAVGAGWSSTRESASSDDPLAGIDTDAEFAALIAGWDRPPPPRTDRPNEPGTEQGDAEHGEKPDDDGSGDAREEALAEMAALDRIPVAPPPDEFDALEDEEHYEPPAPPPLPVPEPATLGAAAVFLAGILVVAKGSWFGLSGDVSFPLGIVLVLAGFVLFVLRLRDASGDEDDDEDGPDDDGARI